MIQSQRTTELSHPYYRAFRKGKTSILWAQDQISKSKDAPQMQLAGKLQNAQKELINKL